MDDYYDTPSGNVPISNNAANKHKNTKTYKTNSENSLDDIDKILNEIIGRPDEI